MGGEKPVARSGQAWVSLLAPGPVLGTQKELNIIFRERWGRLWALGGHVAFGVDPPRKLSTQTELGTCPRPPASCLLRAPTCSPGQPRELEGKVSFTNEETEAQIRRWST